MRVECHKTVLKQTQLGRQKMGYQISRPLLELWMLKVRPVKIRFARSPAPPIGSPHFKNVRPSPYCRTSPIQISSKLFQSCTTNPMSRWTTRICSWNSIWRPPAMRTPQWTVGWRWICPTKPVSFQITSFTLKRPTLLGWAPVARHC